MVVPTIILITGSPLPFGGGGDNKLPPVDTGGGGGGGDDNDPWKGNEFLALLAFALVFVIIILISALMNNWFA